MTDKEALNLIEHYRWKVQPTLENKWAVDGEFGSIRGETLREAIQTALEAQAEWATFRADR
jgi:hypothetical protein